jgi:hypothetical protein
VLGLIRYPSVDRVAGGFARGQFAGSLQDRIGD